MERINELTAREMASAIVERRFTSEAFVSACLGRIQEREGSVRAWTHVAREGALAEARARDRELPRSPLHGVPIAVKDVFDTHDLPTTYGSPIYDGYLPRCDAACVAQIRAAGAVVLGKTVTTEFAAVHNPVPTRNPHNLERSAGASSGGSAAAVADFMVPLAFGTQTGGSVIRPAAFCGVVGFKPTFNLIDRAGMKVMSQSLDTIGTLARSVPDAALMVGILHGKPLGSFDEKPAAPRIGFCRSPVWHKADDSTKTLIEAAAARLARAGAIVTEIELPPPCVELPRVREMLSAVEGAHALAHERRVCRDRLYPELAESLDRGTRIPVDDYLAGLRKAERCRLMVDDLFADADVFITPSAVGEAPDDPRDLGDIVFNNIWSVLHVPCVTVPALVGPRGLPIGLQVVGPRFGDDRTLTYAEWIHRSLV